MRSTRTAVHRQRKAMREGSYETDGAEENNAEADGEDRE